MTDVLVQHWAVEVRVNGDSILTIESNMLSGVSDLEPYADTIRECGRHLLAFIGDKDAEPFTSPCPICGGHDDDRQMMCEACGGSGLLGTIEPPQSTRREP